MSKTVEPSTNYSVSISTSFVETLSSASTSRPACLQCSLMAGCTTPFLRPWIPKGWTGKILGVGEAPGKDEDEESGRPFTGPSGKLLYRMLAAAGFRDNDLALVNAIRCRPRANKTPTMRQVRSCRPFLIRVVEQLKPSVVVAFGAVAAKGLLDRGSASITSLRGRPVSLQFESGQASIPIRVTYHPAAILRGATHLQKRVVEDLTRLRVVDRRDLEIVSDVLTDKVLSVDTEYDPNGNLLTLALAGATKARAWDVAYNPGATG